MSDGNKNRSTGKFREYTSLPIDNPDVSPKKDWWDELCKAHGAKNYWKKGSKNRKSGE